MGKQRVEEVEARPRVAADREPSRIDAEKESRIVRLVYLIAQDVGNAALRPAMTAAMRNRSRLARRAVA